MMEYARAEKQREHQPLFLTLRESVQFSPARKKPMRFLCLVCRPPSQAAVTNIEIKSQQNGLISIYFV
ncbi:hypothetical protein, partial [Alistipes finegoldii]|uniref:hypothetical protein n=1 Tax=Alistipes finegoldii TaxID=214856 RepID=UPI003AABFA24